MIENEEELMIINFDYTIPLHKLFIDKIQAEAKVMGLKTGFANIEE